MDEEYIRMCREATEIQEGWEPKSGDILINKGNPSRPSFCFVFSTHYINDIGHFERFDWLPRQEDLQKIIGKHKGKPQTGIDLIQMLDKWKKAPSEWADYFKMNITQFWLCFVMEEVYGKQWNGETWEKMR